MRATTKTGRSSMDSEQTAMEGEGLVETGVIRGTITMPASGGTLRSTSKSKSPKPSRSGGSAVREPDSSSDEEEASPRQAGRRSLQDWR